MTKLSIIETDLVEAQKAKDETKVSVLRMLKSAIKNEEINTKKELLDAGIDVIIEKQAKQRRESIVQYKEGGRDELKEKEEKELEILKNYLPKKLSDAEVEKAVEETLSSLGDEKDFGKVMGIVMGKLQGKADGNTVREMVQKKLN